MPDYMEALVSQLGLPKVLNDLRNVVIGMATETGNPKLWLLEQDLCIAVIELGEKDES